MTLRAIVALMFFSGGMAIAAQLSSSQQQKLDLVAKLLENSAVVQRIEASDNKDAQSVLRAARSLYLRAAGEIQAGNFSNVDRALNEALALIGKARAMVPDPEALTKTQQIRYGQLMASIESVQASYLHHLSHVGGRAETDLRWQAASQLVNNARNYAGRDDFSRANQLLIRAEGDLLAALESVLGGKTLEYTNHFSDPKDEFSFELQRNRSYRELVPQAITELKPAMSAVKLADGYLNAGLALREEAEKHASHRDFSRALDVIRRSTSELQRALQAAGLVVPKE